MPQSVNRYLAAAVVVLALACVGLIIALAIVSSKDSDSDSGKHEAQEMEPCVETNLYVEEVEPENPGVFHDLTTKEIIGLKEYLYNNKELDLVRPNESKKDANFVFTAELHIPNKSDVLSFLDQKSRQPPREAKVVIIRGKPPNTGINEIIVGPLPNPSSHRALPGISASLPYFYRPMTEEDYGSVTEFVTNEIQANLGGLFDQCYGTNLTNCGEKCLSFLYASSFSPASSGVNERKTWYWLTWDAEYYTLHPVDFAALVNIKQDGSEIDRVWFAGAQYSMNDLKTKFQNGKVTCTKENFPEVNKNLFSTMHRRGQIPETGKNKRAPKFVLPDGLRYKVTGRHVKYMDWTFDFRLSTSYGPQLYDIRFRNDRIVYELGLQEISVFYSGHSPQQRFSDYMDSAELIGPSAQGLIPGVDCPDHATYYDTMHITETSETADKTANVFCIFELNTGEPLRRHHSYFDSEGKVYEGVENVVLVLRTVVTVVNYDYILDFRFFQNGVMEVKGLSTGYILANAYSHKELIYGFKLHDHIVANFHTHMFNFKVDLDIKGQANRYEIINIDVETEKNEFSVKENSTYSQGYITRHIQVTEKEAAYKFNFETPKYHLFYNNQEKDSYGNPLAYRLINHGMVKQIIPRGHNKEPAINWARYQHAVTKHKDTEAHSSSMYSMFDTDDQVVDFQGFIDDNESIVDEDLVLWVTLGVHHIPRKEDLPLTTTPGMGLSFYLQPYNYFSEDPAMSSQDAIRITPKDSGINIERNGMPTDSTRTCVPQKNNFEKMIAQEPDIVFEN